MTRHATRVIFALLLAAVPAALGTLTALAYSGPGTLLLGRLLGDELGRRFRGRFTIERVSGSFLGGVELAQVTILDSAGGDFARVDRIRVRYAVANFLAGRVILQDAVLDRPVIRIIKRGNGRLNFQEIFKLGESSGGGPSRLVELRDVRLRGASLEAWLPWSPPDTAVTPAQVAVALAADRARPGREIRDTPDGLRRVLRLDPLDARLPLLRISAPDRSPLTFDVDSLATRINDPAVTIEDLAAHVWTRGDSLAFTLHRAALPGSRASGGGVITWPEGPLRYDFALEAPAVDLADLLWISPDFPVMTGRTLVTAKWRTRRLTSYVLRGLDFRGPRGRVTGGVTVLTDTRRGLGVEDMALRLEALDLDVPRPYLDTLPLHGTLTGRLAGSGFLDGLDLDADVVFRDAAVPGEADNRFVGAGHIIFGGRDGPLFDSLEVARADLDLRTVRLLAPAVTLDGRLDLVGRLRGPWRNVTFGGAMVHQDVNRPPSRADGSVRLDTRADTLRFAVDVRLMPLAFDGIRGSFPTLPVLGTLSGPLQMDGVPARFRITADLRGESGVFQAHGGLGYAPGRLTAESLAVEFSSFNLAAAAGRGPHTGLRGSLVADGALDSLAGPSGGLTLAVARGAVGSLPLDTLFAVLHAAVGVITADTVLAAWPGGSAAGAGALGWRDDAGGQVTVAFRADTLGLFDSLLTSVVELPDSSAALDSGAARVPLGGRLDGVVAALGSLQHPRVLLNVRGRDLRWRGVRAPAAAFNAGWHAADRPEIGAALRVDSVLVGQWALRDVVVAAGGYQDSLRWSGEGALGTAAGVTGAGEWWSTGPAPVLRVDSATAMLPAHRWRLVAPVTARLGAERWELSDVRIEAADGSGSLTLTGSVPRAGPGHLDLSVLGLELQDVYAVLQRDTAGVAGSIGLDLALGGTAGAPTLRGTASLADLSFGDFGSPFVQGIVDYGDRRLELNLLLWKTGQPVLRVEARLPVDLALRPVASRLVEGPLSVRAIADSTDLSVMEAFTRNLRRVRGTLRADVEIVGSWNAPRLTGAVDIAAGSATIPGLGVQWSGVNLAARLTGDSVVVDSLLVQSGEGSLRATGALRLERLTTPTLDLRFRARRFRALDVRRFLTLDASGTLALTGPLLRPRLSGQVTADDGNLHFADLITKRIVDLENPGDSGLIDLDLVRAERLGANFQNRFLDSLSIDALRLEMGESFWLRSSEANIQLAGNLTIGKSRQGYRYDGALDAVRGNYALRIGGVVTRDFTVSRGSVRYFGTPDLNAELDIEARHTVISTLTSDEIPVVARITGTMLQPRLELTSDERPPLSQTELVSYLMFGRPTFSLQGTGAQAGQYDAAIQAGLSYLSSALSSELQRALISDLGVPIDYIDIRPGGVGAARAAGQSPASQLALVSVGRQFGRRWFVTLVADLCTNTQRFYPNAEFRISRQFRLKSSVEPAYTCTAAATSQAFAVNKYQVGLDLLWEREY